MKLIILAAGYATRLYPLTLNQPKPLLAGGGEADARARDRQHLNHSRYRSRLHRHEREVCRPFRKVGRKLSPPNLHFSFTIVNDQSTDEANKLGAIGDMHLVLTKHEINDDIIVVGGDNLFSDDLAGLVTTASRRMRR